MRLKLSLIVRSSLAFIAIHFASIAQASEPILAYSYVAETPPKGSIELSQHINYSTGKSEGKYDLVETRTELEYAITNKWLMALYLNAYQVSAQNNNSVKSRNDYTAIGDGDEVSGGGPVTFGRYVPAIDTLPVPSALYKNRDIKGVSIESIYQLYSPISDPFGLAVYAEYSYGKYEKELEFKLLAQKNLLNDRLALVSNVAVEFEKESWSQIRDEKEAKLIISGGASYLVGSGVRLGLEGFNERGFEGGYQLSAKHRDYSAWFLGPTVHWANQSYFGTLSWQHQLPMSEAYTHAAQNEQIDHLVFKNTDKNQFKLIVGMVF